MLLDLSEAHVKQVAHVLAGRLAAVADVEQQIAQLSVLRDSIADLRQDAAI